MAQKKAKKGASKATKRGSSQQLELRALKRSLEQVGREFDELPQIAKAISRVYRKTNFGSFAKEITDVGKIEIRPPDDLKEELEKLRDKLERLRRDSQRDDPQILERKVPWRYQIDVASLIDILIEILHILMKLHRRSLRPEG